MDQVLEFSFFIFQPGWRGRGFPLARVG